MDPDGGIGLGVDIDPEHGTADSGGFTDDLVVLLEELGRTARDLGVGVLILVDELQGARPEELTAVNTAVHHLGQADEPLPLSLVGAGLPSLPAQLADATSCAERLYDYRSIGLLDQEAARELSSCPQRTEGCTGRPAAWPQR